MQHLGDAGPSQHPACLLGTKCWHVHCSTSSTLPTPTFRGGGVFPALLWADCVSKVKRWTGGYNNINAIVFIFNIHTVAHMISTKTRLFTRWKRLSLLRHESMFRWAARVNTCA